MSVESLTGDGAYRVEWRGMFGSIYRLWQYDDGLLSGGDTEGWHEIGEFDARVNPPEEVIADQESRR